MVKGCLSDANFSKCPQCIFHSMVNDSLVMLVTMPAVMMSRAGWLRLMTILYPTLGCMSQHCGKPMVMSCLSASITILASMAIVPRALGELVEAVFEGCPMLEFCRPRSVGGVVVHGKQSVVAFHLFFQVMWVSCPHAQLTMTAGCFGCTLGIPCTAVRLLPI